MTEKRDESRVDDFYSSVQDRIILAPFVQMGLSLRDAGTAVSVARGIIEDMESVDTLGSLAIREQLASVTRERDAAVRRVGELETAVRRAVKYFHEDKATTPGTTRLARLVSELESLLTPKEPSDA